MLTSQKRKTKLFFCSSRFHLKDKTFPILLQTTSSNTHLIFISFVGTIKLFFALCAIHQSKPSYQTNITFSISIMSYQMETLYLSLFLLRTWLDKLKLHPPLSQCIMVYIIIKSVLKVIKLHKYKDNCESLAYTYLLNM